ncbi:polyprenyl synthetase family protein [Nocardia sp. NPDC050412]|uniref:polyprenyl synthetase family protein n=1 Tax=Nocardia sp. NPDC050412 TaxID=3364320 RepID=UPI00378813B5
MNAVSDTEQPKSVDAARVLADARLRVEPAVRAAVMELPEPLQRMAFHHFGWSDLDGASSGKMVRGALTLAVAAGCGVSTTGVQAAAAVELLHNFTLVHDDLMDGDTIRRGRVTVWRRWGVDEAVLLGDALHALAIRTLTGLPGGVVGEAVDRLESAAVQLCGGQYDDIAFDTRPQVTVADYLDMAAGKTGALMGCACALGALSAGADTDTVAAFDIFGRELGLAFQITDDLLGIWGDPSVTGKSAGNDLARRKRTFPVVAALESTGAAAAELCELYARGGEMTDTDIAHTRDLLDRAGGRAAARCHADRHRHAAIDALPPHYGTDAALRALARLATERSR